MAITQRGPRGGVAFWTAVVATMAVGAALVRWLPAHEGRPHRTPLPVWIKTPAVAAVIGGLIEIKHLLGGFTTYSSYAFQSLELVEHGRAAAALAYVVATNVLAIGAAWAGLRLFVA
jgi:hypothetical protein